LALSNCERCNWKHPGQKTSRWKSKAWQTGKHKYKKYHTQRKKQIAKQLETSTSHAVYRTHTYRYFHLKILIHTDILMGIWEYHIAGYELLPDCHLEAQEQNVVIVLPITSSSRCRHALITPSPIAIPCCYALRPFSFACRRSEYIQILTVEGQVNNAKVCHSRTPEFLLVRIVYSRI